MFHKLSAEDALAWGPVLAVWPVNRSLRPCQDMHQANMLCSCMTPGVTAAGTCHGLLYKPLTAAQECLVPHRWQGIRSRLTSWSCEGRVTGLADHLLLSWWWRQMKLQLHEKSRASRQLQGQLQRQLQSPACAAACACRQQCLAQKLACDRFPHFVMAMLPVAISCSWQLAAEPQRESQLAEASHLIRPPGIRSMNLKEID